ncbi:MAG: outer membrane protein assembly factor BamA [Elusimicrobia bacterium]|nr:outer membrane protein assembly factor BamA [Elusimicrobiota bacterium]
MNKRYHHRIRKFIFLAVLITVFSLIGHLAFAQEGKKIIEVAVDGLKNVPLKNVWEVAKTRKGQTYKQETIDSDLRAMFDLNLFSSINIDVSDKNDGVKVTFIVVEKMIIKQIDFKGNKAFKASALKDEVTCQEKEAIDEGQLAESKNKIITKYKDKGYAEIKVETFTTDLGEGKQTLTFFVTEGNKIKIENVEVVGNRFLAAKKVQRVMKVRKGKIYKEEVMTKGVEDLTKYYRKRGFYNFKMEEPQITYNEDHSQMMVKITLSEGLRYKIGQITFSGNTVLAEKDFRKDLTVKENRLFNQEDFDQTTANIQAMYADKGHVFARINPNITTHDDTLVMDLDYQIAEGPMAYVGKVEIAGNEITRDYVIQREILLHQGDPLSMTRVRRSQEQLYNLGFFEDVGLDTRPNQEKPEDQLDLIFKVKEKSQVNALSLGLGYSTVDKVVGNMQVQINNLFGRGQRVNLMYEIGSLRQNYEVSFFEPWFMQKYFSFGANVFNTRREKSFYWSRTEKKYFEDNEGKNPLVPLKLSSSSTENDFYSETSRGIGFNFGKRFKEIYNSSIGYSYEDVRIRNLSERFRQEDTNETNPYSGKYYQNISDEIAGSTDRGLVKTSAISLGLSRDTRDNVFDSTTGSRHSINYKVAGGYLGGDNYFQKLVGETSWFFPSFWKFVWGLHGMAGVVQPFGKTSVIPVYERFYLGGAETVRGYEYRGQIGEISGGKFVSLFNLEYSFPIIREKRQTILKGAFFYDAGNTWNTTKLHHHDELTGRNNYTLQQGVGFSLRFTLPMFPIRFDWGYGLNHRDPQESKTQFYFSIGPVF